MQGIVVKGKLAVTWCDDAYESKWKTHHDFVRMLWILFARHGRRKGLKLVWQYTPFNTTKTYFWTQIVFFAMHNSHEEEAKALLCSDFEYLLVMNPSLANDLEGLMAKFYSEKLLASLDGDKKDEMVLPDLCALPSITPDLSQFKERKVQLQHKVEEDDDEAFIASFEARSFKAWDGHTSFVRVIWCYLDAFDGQKGGVAKIRSEWRRFRKEHFHESQMYFFVHMARYWRVLFKEQQKQQKQASEWSFTEFVAFCRGQKKCRLLDEQWWTKFYSEAVMHHKGFHGMDASQEMVLPDKKPLPQIKLVKK